MALTQRLGEEGFASAKIGDQDIVVNHQTHLATLSLPVDPGPGRAVRRDPRQRPAAVQRAPRRDHRPASSAATVRALENRGSAPRADCHHPGLRRRHPASSRCDGGRIVDLAVRLEPAPSHTIAGELGYGTGQGARLEASWTDRNFFNPEGALTLRGIAGTKEQLAGVQFRRSNFLQRDQVLNLQASASHQKFDAYEAQDHPARRQYRAAEQFHLAEDMDLDAGAELLATDERGVFSAAGLKDTRTFLIAALAGEPWL